MSYELKLHRDVEKQIERIPKKQRARLVETMRSLGDEPRPTGCIKLEDQLYRVSQGQYRIIYAIFDEEVIVFVCKVARRTETTYRNLQKMLEQAIRSVIEG
jgi:mRNA interferase RelE/StbE